MSKQFGKRVLDNFRCKNPVFLSICAVAVLIFLHITLGKYVTYLYNNLLIIPCVLFCGFSLVSTKSPIPIRKLLLPALMIVWFLLLQNYRSSIGANTQSLGLFFSIYLFAFPMALLTNDGDEKQYLKMFAGIYTTAAAVLAGYSLLLIFDCLPGFLTDMVYWDGARLAALWHPNLSACFFMIGIGFSLAFFFQASDIWKRVLLLGLIALLFFAMALTNGRTTILLAGAMLGGTVFFRIVKKCWKNVVPGLLVAIGIIIAVFTLAGQLYAANQEYLLQKFSSQYHEATQNGTAGDDTSTLPIQIDPETEEITLKYKNPQGSLISNLKTLNSRTTIWNSAFYAIREWPALLIHGIDDPGRYISYYTPFTVSHAHNSWIQCLLGLGFPGFAIATVFTLTTFWNCAMVLLKHNQDIWKVTVSLLSLCLMAAGFMEPYLFLTPAVYHSFDFLFFLCAGYLSHWQAEENQTMLRLFRNRLSR